MFTGRGSPVIIVLNGAFGVGKTTAARLLVRRLTGAVLYDPERVGSVARALSRPFERTDDYQDLRLWQPAVVLGARVLRVARRCTLVLPITLYRPSGYRKLIAHLRVVDPDIQPFRLSASPDVLRRRILSDEADLRARGWRLAHLNACVVAMRDPALGVAIDTDGQTPAQVVDAIMGHIAATRPASSSARASNTD